MKALVITVGTGVGPDREQRVMSLAHGIAFSISDANPNKIVFLTTEEGEQETLPKVLEQVGKLEYEVVRIADKDDFDRIYKQVIEVLQGLTEEGFSPDQITVDYTSGTKAMSVGTAIAATAFEIGSLRYISGPRERGTVIKGKERVISQRPYRILLDRRLRQIESLFNRYQFRAALLLLGVFLEHVQAREDRERLEELRTLCETYVAWDHFDHQGAWELLQQLELHHLELDLSANKGFLGRLVNSRNGEPYYLADLLNNAERRAEEGKFDDAVARLYRAAELLAQMLLRERGLIDEERLEAHGVYYLVPERVEEELRAERFPQYRKKVDERGRLKLGLQESFHLLAELGERVGREFLDDEGLRGALQVRNGSILAHGLRPVAEEDHEKLRSRLVSLASLRISELEELQQAARFPVIEK